MSHPVCSLFFICLFVSIGTAKIEKLILCLRGGSLKLNERDKKRYYLHKKIVKLNNFLFII